MISRRSFLKLAALALVSRLVRPVKAETAADTPFIFGYGRFPFKFIEGPDIEIKPEPETFYIPLISRG